MADGNLSTCSRTGFDVEGQICTSATLEPLQVEGGGGLTDFKIGCTLQGKFGWLRLGHLAIRMQVDVTSITETECTRITRYHVLQVARQKLTLL